jgi:predicted transposase YbfD/YdcC
MPTENRLFDVFSQVTDPRRKGGNYIYPLDEILFLVISGVLSGLEDWVHISAFGKDQIEWLRRFLPFENGIPSHDCLGYVFSLMDTTAFGQAFVEWSEGLSKRTKGEVVSIDGKRLCGSYDTYKGKSAIHLVSAFASANGLALGQVKTPDKSNEIKAIPELLNLICVEGCLVTIDAMGCQKAIAEKIKEEKADYVLALKGNQPELFEEVKRAFEFMPISEVDQELDQGHGRIEKRICETITDLRFIDESLKWKGIKAVARINAHRTHKIDGKQEQQYRYYISSITNAKQINQAVRMHWAIENKLHWVLDVRFLEDNSRKRNGEMPENFSLITKMAINLIKMHPAKGSIKGKRLKAGWNQTFRQELLQI